MRRSSLGDYAQFVKPHWSSDEVGNLTVVANFLLTLRSKDFDRLLAEYGDHPYVQHNIAMKDGVMGVVVEGRKAAKLFPEFSIEPKRVYVDDDCVVIHSHMTTKSAHRGKDGKGLNVIDVWRVRGGKIAEHWDAIQPLDLQARLFALFFGAAVMNRNGRY